MKRTLAITAVTTLLALSLAACGAERTGASDNVMNGTDATAQTPGVGTAGTARDNVLVDDADGAAPRVQMENDLGSVAGALRNGRDPRGNSSYGVGGPNSSVYTATNNGGVTGVHAYQNDADVARAAAEGDRYARMLENGRVHDHDGFLFDGENTSYNTL